MYFVVDILLGFGISSFILFTNWTWGAVLIRSVCTMLLQYTSTAQHSIESYETNSYDCARLKHSFTAHLCATHTHTHEYSRRFAIMLLLVPYKVLSYFIVAIRCNRKFACILCAMKTFSISWSFFHSLLAHSPHFCSFLPHNNHRTHWPFNWNLIIRPGTINLYDYHFFNPKWNETNTKTNKKSCRNNYVVIKFECSWDIIGRSI